MAGPAHRMGARRVSTVAAMVLLGAAPFIVGRLAPGVAPAWLVMTGCLDTTAYFTLFCLFALSLRGGREPMVTGLARRVRRTMPDKVVRYTRRVTVAWSVFFAGHLAASAALAVLAPAAWAVFVTVLNMPLLAAMVLGEFALRTVMFRHEERTGLAATLAAMRTTRLLHKRIP